MTTKQKALFLDSEATFATDPDTTGGGYLWLPTVGDISLKPGKVPLETNYNVHRPHPKTAAVAGPDGGELSCTIPLWGLSNSAGDGDPVPSDDALDTILEAIFGTQVSNNGEGVVSGSTGSSLVLDAGTSYAQGDVVCLVESGVTTQWVRLETESPPDTWAVSPAFLAANQFTGSAIAYGSNAYYYTAGGGNSMAMVFRETVGADVMSTNILGVGCTGFSLKAESGQLVTIDLAFAYDNKVEAGGSHGSTPTAGPTPPASPIRMTGSTFHFGGTIYATSSVELDLNLTAVHTASTAGTNGRGGFITTSMSPEVMVHPLRTDAIEDLMRDATVGDLFCVLGDGSGTDSDGIDSCCFEAAEAYASEVTTVDDNGRERQDVKFTVTDEVQTAGASSRVFQFARA